MLSPPRRPIVIGALLLVIALCVPRYRYGVSIGDYARAAQMVVLVWTGFFVSARYWVKNDEAFSRGLMAAAAVISVPLLVYHVYDATGFAQTSGNLVLLAGIGIYTCGLFMRGERVRKQAT